MNTEKIHRMAGEMGLCKTKKRMGNIMKYHFVLLIFQKLSVSITIDIIQSMQFNILQCNSRGMQKVFLQTQLYKYYVHYVYVNEKH